MPIPNPYTRLRESAKRTQQYLADIADVDVQWIHRLESGLVSRPNKNVFNHLYDLAPGQTKSRAEAWGDFCAEWDEWIASCRESVKERLLSEGFEFPRTRYAATKNYSRPVMTPSQFREYVMLHLAEDPLTITARSTNAFCRELKLHPYLVQRWEAAGGDPPPTIAQALTQSGIDLSAVRFA